MGVFLCTAGVLMVAAPPRQAVSWGWVGLAAALVGCAALALLPQTWFSQPEWRHELAASPVIPQAASISVVPRETVFWMTLLAASLLTGLYSLAQPVRSPAQLVFAAAGSAVCAGYAVLSMYAERTGWTAPFDGADTFGFFPNRNHTATFLVTGCLLGLGAVTVALRHRHHILGAVAGLSLAICVWTLLFESTSRAGVIFLAVGTVLWGAGLGRKNYSKPFVISFGVISLIALIFFLTGGSKVRDRLLGNPAPVPPAAASAAPKEVSFDQRLLIYQDTLRMIADFPLTGSGLGTYQYIYPQYAKKSLLNAGSIHPESDWLLLATEAGPAAVLVALALIVGLCSRLKGMSAHPYWPLRWAIVCAALTASLHGLLDVPLHRVQLGWWILALGGLGLGLVRGQDNATAARRVQHLLFVAGGLGSLWLGWRLATAEWAGGTPLPPFASDAAQKQISTLYAQEKFEVAIDRTHQAIAESPMALPLYFQMGTLKLHFDDADAETDAYFAAQRVLDPCWPRIPFGQAIAWLSIDLRRAVCLCWDAVNRQARIEKTMQLDPADGANLYSDFLSEASRYPSAFPALMPAEQAPPGIWLRWLAATPAGKDPFPTAAANQTFLSSMDEPLRKKFLSLWFHRGNRKSLTLFLDTHEDWQDSAWIARVKLAAAASDYQQAIAIICQRYGITLELPQPTAPNPEAEISDDPLVAFEALRARQNLVAARRALTDGISAGSPQIAELYRLRAALALQTGDFAAAWKDLEASLTASGRGISD